MAPQRSDKAARSRAKICRTFASATWNLPDELRVAIKGASSNVRRCQPPAHRLATMGSTCMCLCSAIRDLAQHPDEARATALAPDLNIHLGALQKVLSQSKAVSRDVQFRITSSNDRVEKAWFVESLNLEPINRIHDRSNGDAGWFWAGPSAYSEDTRSVHLALQRRLASVVVFLRSILDVHAPVPPIIVDILGGKYSYAEIRNAGRKYLKMARKLGGLGAILWLPAEIPHTTYERYIHIDDEKFFGRLNTIRPHEDRYAECVQQLIMHQLHDSLPLPSTWNLVAEYPDVLPTSSLMVLLLYALGGLSVPSIILESVRLPQRRWNAEGEIIQTSALDFVIPVEFVGLLSNDAARSKGLVGSQAVQQITEDKIATWSVPPETMRLLHDVLFPATQEYLGSLALKIMCFVCPPCLEGNLDWSVPLKRLVWPFLEKAVTRYKVPLPLRSQVVEALLYFAERDSVPIRHAAVDLAKSFLRKPMPYHLHASVVLFQSTLLRIDANFTKSESRIRDFTWKGPKPVTRRDHALVGRLHISQIENKIKMYDTDVSSSIYKWEALQPRSSLDIEVTFRLQSTAARFFQSVGDFPAARASLNQFLSLDSAKPIRSNSRRLLVGRLADVYCEMQDFEEALALLQAEIQRCETQDRSRRWFSRLLLAQVEANIGLGRMIPADAILEELASTAPSELSDIHDEQLYMRRLFAAARMTHMRSSPSEAVRHWQSVMREVERMHTLSGFATAVIHLSAAHAQLVAGDRDSGRRSWAAGLEILERDKCEFWLPAVPTLWLRWVAEEVHRLQGWGFRMMQPGGKPDVVWPLES